MHAAHDIRVLIYRLDIVRFIRQLNGYYCLIGDKAF